MNDRLKIKTILYLAWTIIFITILVTTPSPASVNSFCQKNQDIAEMAIHARLNETRETRIKIKFSAYKPGGDIVTKAYKKNIPSSLSHSMDGREKIVKDFTKEIFDECIHLKSAGIVTRYLFAFAGNPYDKKS